MTLCNADVTGVREVAQGVYVLSFRNPEVARTVLPGQFLNIRVHEGLDPFLRRPFSVYRVEKDVVEIIFQVIGKGTAILAGKKRGDVVNILGPLGVPFGIGGEFTKAILVAGGLGIAPMPILGEHLRKAGKRVEIFVGARTSGQLALHHLKSPHVATDDGSRGFHGTVVALVESYFKEHPQTDAKVFACGPTRMLEAVSRFAQASFLPCELSLEGEMACGIGICQGCPVERINAERRYALVCTEGPTFDCTTIRLREA